MSANPIGGFVITEQKVAADEMGLSEGAVKFHLHAGRERLRRGLDVAREGER